jgi:hypothetical protein
MKKHWFCALALLAMLSFAATSALADKDKGQGHGNGHGHSAKDHDDDDHGDNHDGWERRGQFEYRTYSEHDVPPGWSHGKKTGWGDCGMPPGQAKKYGCRTYTHEGRPYYYYHDDEGRTVVRRPIIEVHASVDIVR